MLARVESNDICSLEYTCAVSFRGTPIFDHNKNNIGESESAKFCSQISDESATNITTANTWSSLVSIRAYLLAGVAFHTMVLISQERLALIAFPLRAKTLCTYTRTWKLLLCIWAMSALCYLPLPLLYIEIRTFELSGTTLSMCGYFSGSTGAIIYFSFIAGFYFLVPLVLMTGAYAVIFKVLYQRLETMDTTASTGGSKSLLIRRKLAKMMLAVSIIFAICWGPYFALYLWVAAGLGIQRL